MKKKGAKGEEGCTYMYVCKPPEIKKRKKREREREILIMSLP